MSCQYERETPSPRSTPWGAYRSASHKQHRSSFYNCLQCCHSHTHSHLVTVERSMVVGHVAMVHTCSFMCTNHIDMIAHTAAFLRVGEHSYSMHHLHRTVLLSVGAHEHCSRCRRSTSSEVYRCRGNTLSLPHGTHHIYIK